MTRLRNNRRRGATTVEFALVIPLVFVFFFAAFEFSRMSMIRHTVELAAYEGARRAIVPGATAADAINRANLVLSGVGTRNASVTVTPNPFNSQTKQITVDVQVPMNSNSWIPPNFLRGITFDRAFTLGRENVSWGLTTQAPPAPPPQPAVSPPASGGTDNHNSGNGQNGNNQNTNSNNTGNGNGNWGNNGGGGNN